MSLFSKKVECSFLSVLMRVQKDHLLLEAQRLLSQVWFSIWFFSSLGDPRQNRPVVSGLYSLESSNENVEI